MLARRKDCQLMRHYQLRSKRSLIRAPDPEFISLTFIGFLLNQANHSKQLEIPISDALRHSTARRSYSSFRESVRTIGPEMAREIMSRSSSFRFNTPRQITAPDAMLMKKHHRVNPALSAGDVIQSYQKIRKHFVSLLSQECSVATCVDSTQKIKTDVIFALYL